MLLALGFSPPRLDRLRALWQFVVVVVTGGLVFAWMCDAVGDRNGVTAVDGPVSVWFASHRSATEGQLGLLLAKMTAPAALVTMVLVAAALLYWRGHRSESTVLVGSTFLAYAVGAVAKMAEHRARPVAPVNLAPESEASFPSGHVLVVATVAFVVLGLAWARLSPAGRVAATTVAVTATLAIALDRLVVGAHWLTDVTGSLALAAVIVSVVLAAHRLLQPEASPRHNNPAARTERAGRGSHAGPSCGDGPGLRADPGWVDRAWCAIGKVRGDSAEAQPRYRNFEEPRVVTPTGSSAEAEASSASAAIREYGLAGGRAEYVSHQVDAGGRAITVYRVRGGDFDAAVRRLVPIEIKLRFLDAAHSRAELADARQRLWTLPHAEQIRSVSIRWDGSAVVIVVGDDVAAAQARYDRALPGLVVVEGRREEQR